MAHDAASRDFDKEVNRFRKTVSSFLCLFFARALILMQMTQLVGDTREAATTGTVL
jgi:hypothetical protein